MCAAASMVFGAITIVLFVLTFDESGGWVALIAGASATATAAVERAQQLRGVLATVFDRLATVIAAATVFWLLSRAGVRGESPA